jgi:hypothetical protein
MARKAESIYIRHRAPVVLLLVLIGLLLWEGRRYFIRSWFERGPVRPPERAAGFSTSPRAGPVPPVRVVLIDGLNEAVARQLPNHDSLCRAGLDLRVDVGFPSISLPVQHVLWTGTWQNQSGILFVERQLVRPVFESLPELVTRRSVNAVAVAESHRWIVASFPFSQVIAPAEGQPPFSALDLQQHALLAVQSSAALVFVHLLAVDKAGHRYGTSDPRYRKTALHADDLLGQINDLRQQDWSLLVLSDHGHLSVAPSGHGGTEPSVRLVRACLVGPGIAPGQRGEATMPDLTRILADRLNVPPPRRCQGRSINQVLGGGGAPSQPSSWQPGLLLLPGVMACAGLIWLIIGRSSRVQRGGLVLLLPWGMLLSLLLVVVGFGSPSLSRSYIYPMFSFRLLVAAVPAALFPWLQLRSLHRRQLPLTSAIYVLMSWSLLPTVGALALSGWPLTRPPLVPLLSAWTSTLMVLSSVSLMALALWTMLERPKDPTADP